MTPNDEPISYSGAITAVAVAAVPVFKAFNIQVSEEQADAIFVFLAALIALGTIVLRSRVLPKQKVPPPLGTAPPAAPPETL